MNILTEEIVHPGFDWEEAEVREALQQHLKYTSPTQASPALEPGGAVGRYLMVRWSGIGESNGAGHD
jgi:hypothetical protein